MPAASTPPPVRTVLVAGASGILGSKVARRQLAAGNKVIAFGRDPARLAGLCQQGAEAVVGDLSDRNALASVCRGADQVFTSAHGFLSSSRRGSREIDLAGNRNLIEVASEQGIRHFVFTSVRMNDAMTAIDFMAYKRATEETLRHSGLSYTILRPSVLMDTWAWLVGGAMLDGKPVRVYGNGRNPVNFVAVSDVAELACMALARGEAVREEIEVGGPEDLSQLQVISIFERALGRKAVRRHVPALVLRLLSWSARPFRPAMSRELATGYFMASSPQTLQASSAAGPGAMPMTSFDRWVNEQWLPAVTGGQPAPDPGRAVL